MPAMVGAYSRGYDAIIDDYKSGHTGDDTGAEGDARTGDDDAAEEGNDNDKEDIVVPGPGVGQPQVRKAAWRLLGAVVDVHVLQPSQQPSQPDSSRQPPSSSISQTESQSDETESDKRNEVIRILSTSILLGCTDIDTKIENGRCACAWQEQDKSVQGVMWKSLLGFLGAHPAAWTVSSPPTSNQPTYPAFDPFLSFLRALPSETGIGAGGGAAQVYPVVLVVLGSVPMEVLLAPASGVFGQGEGEEGEGGAEAAEGEERKRNLDKLFDAFWDPWRESQSTTPTGGGRGKAFNAFIQAVLECMVLVVRRVSGSSSFPSQLSSSKSSLTKEEMHWMLNNLVKTQIELVWRAVATAASSSTSSAPSNSGSAAASTKSSNRRAVVVPKPGSKGAGTQAGEEIADVVAKAFGGVLRGLRGVRGDAPYYDTAYETMRGVVKGSVGELGESGTTISTSTSILGNGLGLDWDWDWGWKSPLLNEVFDIVLGRSEQRLADAGADTSADAGALTLLDELLCTFGFTSPDVDVETTDRIDTLIVRNACTLLLYPEGGLGLKLLATYLMYRDGSGATTSSSSSTQSSLLWLALLEQVVSRQHASTSFEQALSRLLDLFRMLDSSSGSGDNLKTRAKLSAPLIFCLAKRVQQPGSDQPYNSYAGRGFEATVPEAGAGPELKKLLKEATGMKAAPAATVGDNDPFVISDKN
ncbi:hypothetical protein BT96DRAFT_1023224 [Gymnopus androsaceus JB14]|uniref:Uncharacterized protein n=1 Tax=Gymnopus androsaceus JB14 TaxID=1447944 RepID=A0A6A4H5V3_9AGAR|nr:hypothetical protein BT96DRAFT_1023224 [Gymnopus androsaceus JB14]